MKLEQHGLFRALKTVRTFVIGVESFCGLGGVIYVSHGFFPRTFNPCILIHLNSYQIYDCEWGSEFHPRLSASTVVSTNDYHIACICGGLCYQSDKRRTIMVDLALAIGVGLPVLVMVPSYVYVPLFTFL